MWLGRLSDVHQEQELRVQFSRWDSCRTCEWSALADDFRTFLAQGNLEIDGLDTFTLVST